MPLAQIASPLNSESLLAGADIRVLIAGGVYISLVLLAGLAVEFWLLAAVIIRARTWMVHAARALVPRLSGHDVAMYLALLFVMHAAGLLAGLVLAPESDVPLMIVQSITLHWTILVLTVVFLRVRAYDMTFFFGINIRSAARDVGAGIVAFLGMMPVLLLSTILYQTLLKAFHISVDFQDILINLTGEYHWAVKGYLFFLAVILAPLAEEVLFRGILLRFAVQRVGVLTGCLLVSLLFAAIHLHVPSLVPIFILAFSLSLAYLSTGSLLVPVTMHVLFNAQSLAFMLLLRSGT